MGAKGYRNIAKSGVKAASARRKQAVANALARKRPKPSRPPKKPETHVVTKSDHDADQACE